MISSPVALITGASKGLGRAIARSFSRHGFAVGINYHQNTNEARETASLIHQAGGSSLLLKADVSRSADVQAMVKRVTEEWGRIDVLINNAGIVRSRTIHNMKDDEWRDVMSVVLDGAFYCTRAVLPLMRAQKDGTIINISSYLALRGAKGVANYAAAKAGLITLTKVTALEEGPHNIRANVVIPGFHVTDMNKDVWAKIEEDVMSDHLLGRLPDRDELGGFVVSLALLKSVTGQVFPFESRLM